MGTNKEWKNLLQKCLGLIVHLSGHARCLVCCVAVDIVVLLHEASDSLELCVEGLTTKHLSEQC